MTKKLRNSSLNFAFKTGGNVDFKRKIAFCGVLLNGLTALLL